MANLLVLTPRDPFSAPDMVRLIAELRDAVFVADALSRNTYRPGEQFLSLVSFLGCSPVVALGERGATAEMCRIELPSVLARPVFVAGENMKEPRCPGCGYRTPEGRAIADAWVKDTSSMWTCPVCGREYAAPDLGWRQCAGFGRAFIKVWGIFEGEAVPGERLMAVLEESSGASWAYFYVRCSSE